MVEEAEEEEAPPARSRDESCALLVTDSTSGNVLSSPPVDAAATAAADAADAAAAVGLMKANVRGGTVAATTSLMSTATASVTVISCVVLLSPAWNVNFTCTDGGEVAIITNEILDQGRGPSSEAGIGVSFVLKLSNPLNNEVAKKIIADRFFSDHPPHSRVN